MTLALTLVLALSPTTRADFINGNFEPGSLAPWTVFTAANGTNGASLPDVASFDVTGSGASRAARFDVGAVTADGSQQGGGPAQSLALEAGSLTLGV